MGREKDIFFFISDSFVEKILFYSKTSKKISILKVIRINYFLTQSVLLFNLIDAN